MEHLLNTDIGETIPEGNIIAEIYRSVGMCSQGPVGVLDREMQDRVRPDKF